MTTVETPRLKTKDRHEQREDHLFAGTIPHFQPHNPKFWDRFFSFWPWTKGATEIINKRTSSGNFHSMSADELLSTYRKLQKCCDPEEQELKEAIGYGQRIISEKKHNMKFSQRERDSNSHHSTKTVEGTLRDVSEQTNH